jgi:hypothetical protein
MCHQSKQRINQEASKWAGLVGCCHLVALPLTLMLQAQLQARSIIRRLRDELRHGLAGAWHPCLMLIRLLLANLQNRQNSSA